jgi:hypothetical protein
MDALTKKKLELNCCCHVVTKNVWKCLEIKDGVTPRVDTEDQAEDGDYVHHNTSRGLPTTTSQVTTSQVTTSQVTTSQVTTSQVTTIYLHI